MLTKVWGKGCIPHLHIITYMLSPSMHTVCRSSALTIWDWMGVDTFTFEFEER